MKPHKEQFIALALQERVLRFGSFKLKSGRESPYFFDSGRFASGRALSAVGQCYAAALHELPIGFDMLFGPAYKGIALASALAINVAPETNLPLAFNRKEAKDHGEGGHLIGSPLAGRVLIIDDVITAGTAVREAVALIREAGATPVGVLTALDRQERGPGGREAVVELSEGYGLVIRSVITISDLIAYLLARPESEHASRLSALEAYRARYGA